MNTDKKQNEKMQVGLTTEQIFVIGRAAQVEGVSNIAQYAQQSMLKVARETLAKTEGQK